MQKAQLTINFGISLDIAHLDFLSSINKDTPNIFIVALQTKYFVNPIIYDESLTCTPIRLNMKNLLLILFSLCISISSFAQKPAYRIYNSKGKKVSYKKMLKTLAKEDVVMFGELHNNPIAHWLQLELTTDLDQLRDLQLGAEMFEADNQTAVDLFLKDSIDNKGLDTLARLWPNYKTDYAPLLQYAKDNGLQFTASNVPRRYASMVYRGGFEALDTLADNEKAWIAPLPILFDSLLPKYQQILEMMGGHGSANLVKAQALKDATMAYFILQNLKDGNLFIHYNGSYHSDHYEGIMWYMAQTKPELNYASISTVTQEDISKLNKEHRGTADFIICVDDDMTTTY